VNSLFAASTFSLMRRVQSDKRNSEESYPQHAIWCRKPQSEMT